MWKIIPVLLAILGLGAGIGLGIMARPSETEILAINPCGQEPEINNATIENSIEKTNLSETDVVYVKLNNQFIIPVVMHGNVKSLVVLSLTLEVTADNQDQVYKHEPKLRDVFLQVLFDHANVGGFDDAFTSGKNMSLLRDALFEVARKTFGNRIRDVLIVDLVRQDV